MFGLWIASGARRGGRKFSPAKRKLRPAPGPRANRKFSTPGRVGGYSRRMKPPGGPASKLLAYRKAKIKGLSQWIKRKPVSTETPKFASVTESQKTLMKSLNKMRRKYSSGGTDSDRIINYNTRTKQEVPATVSNRMVQSMNAAQQTRTFFTAYEFGTLPSKATLSSAVQNGVDTNRVFRTTMQEQLSAAIRRQLRHVYGFNQKLFFAFFRELSPGLTIPELDNDYFTLANLGVGNSRSADLSHRGMLIKIRDNFKFTNGNKFFPIKLKIHLIQHNDPVKNLPIEVFTTCLNNGVVDDAQTVGAIPLKRQLAQLKYPTDAINSHTLSTLVDINTKLTDSTRFKDEYHVIKTVSKTLVPGDVWQPSFITHMGRGVDLQEVRDYQVQFDAYRTSLPLGNYKSALTGSLIGPQLHHFYVFEVVGVQCQAFTNDGQDTQFIGTSPGQISAEVETLTDTVYASEALINVESNPGSAYYLTRIFRKSEEPTRRVSYNYEFIGFKGEDAKEIYIPVQTDVSTKYADPIQDF